MHVGRAVPVEPTSADQRQPQAALRTDLPARRFSARTACPTSCRQILGRSGCARHPRREIKRSQLCMWVGLCPSNQRRQINGSHRLPYELISPLGAFRHAQRALPRAAKSWVGRAAPDTMEGNSEKRASDQPIGRPRSPCVRGWRGLPPRPPGRARRRFAPSAACRARGSP